MTSCENSFLLTLGRMTKEKELMSLFPLDSGRGLVYIKSMKTAHSNKTPRLRRGTYSVSKNTRIEDATEMGWLFTKGTELHYTHKIIPSTLEVSYMNSRVRLCVEDFRTAVAKGLFVRN